MTPSPSAITTTGQLRASGHTHRPLRIELRENLLAALAEGSDPWPGIHGFDTTVIPQLERAILAGHDIVLLGERGQGKTRLLRSLSGLLDEWTPVIEGSELGEHPFHLIGDVDPIKVVLGSLPAAPETIHYGLVPRSHRGIVAINELPDLAERIQV